MERNLAAALEQCAGPGAQQPVLHTHWLHHSATSTRAGSLLEAFTYRTEVSTCTGEHQGVCQLRRFNGQPDGEERLLALLRCTGGHVRALQLQQLPVALDLAALFEHLPGCAALGFLRPVLLPRQPFPA